MEPTAAASSTTPAASSPTRPPPLRTLPGRRAPPAAGCKGEDTSRSPRRHDVPSKPTSANPAMVSSSESSRATPSQTCREAKDGGEQWCGKVGEQVQRQPAALQCMRRLAGLKYITSGARFGQSLAAVSRKLPPHLAESRSHLHHAGHKGRLPRVVLRAARSRGS